MSLNAIPGPSNRSVSPKLDCVICSEEIINKCHSNSCAHEFCFNCLKKWSRIRRTCPLCLKNILIIYHTYSHDLGRYTKAYTVPKKYLLIDDAVLRRLSVSRLLYMLGVHKNHVESLRSLRIGYEVENRNLNVQSITELNSNFVESPLHAYNNRRRIYIENLWANPLPDSSCHFRNSNSIFSWSNSTQTNRLRGFIHRDLSVIVSLLRPNDDDSYCVKLLTNIIIRSIIIVYEQKDSFIYTILFPSLEGYTNHFIHELCNYANSAYDMDSYDRNVHYTNHEVPFNPYTELSDAEIYNIANTSLFDVDDMEVVTIT